MTAAIFLVVEVGGPTCASALNVEHCLKELVVYSHQIDITYRAESVIPVPMPKKNADNAFRMLFPYSTHLLKRLCFRV